MVAIIIPSDIMDEWKTSAEESGFFIKRITYIKTTPNKLPKRVLIEFAQTIEEPATNTLVLEETRGEYSEDAKEILRDFYLKID